MIKLIVFLPPSSLSKEALERSRRQTEVDLKSWLGVKRGVKVFYVPAVITKTGEYNSYTDTHPQAVLVLPEASYAKFEKRSGSIPALSWHISNRLFLLGYDIDNFSLSVVANLPE